MSLLTSARPTPEEVASYVVHYRDEVWANARAKWLAFEAMYRRRNPIWEGIDSQLAAFRSSWHPATATYIVDHAVDQQIPYTPKPHVYEAGEGKIHKDRAALKENFLTAVFADSMLREPMPPIRQLAMHMVVYGYAPAEGPVLDFSDMPQEPILEQDEEESIFQARHLAWARHKQNFNPFRFHAPNPSWVLMDPWEKQPKWAIKVTKMDAAQLEALLRTKRWLQDYGAAKEVSRTDLVGEKGDFEPIEVTEVWTAYYYQIYRGTELLLTETNTMGFNPFSHAFPGNGLEVGDRRDPADMCVGILESIQDELTMHAQQVNAQNTSAILEGFRPIFTEGSAAELANMLAKGGIGEGKKDQVWELLRAPLSAQTFQTGEELRERIEHATYALEVGGFKAGGQDTATQQVIRNHASSKRFLPVTMQLEQLLTIWGTRVFMLVERLGLTLTVQGVTITPEDIDGLYDCEVTLESRDPLTEAQMKATAQTEVDKRLKSRRRYYQDFGGEDWETEQNWMLEEEFQDHPYYRTMRMAEIARGQKQLRLAEQLEAKADALMQQLVAQVAQETTPAMPQNGRAVVPAQPGAMP